MGEDTCDWLLMGIGLQPRERCNKPAAVLGTVGYRRCAEHTWLAWGWRLIPPHITDIVAGEFNPYADESFDLYREQSPQVRAERAEALLVERDKELAYSREMFDRLAVQYDAADVERSRCWVQLAEATALLAECRAALVEQKGALAMLHEKARQAGQEQVIFDVYQIEKRNDALLAQLDAATAATLGENYGLG